MTVPPSPASRSTLERVARALGPALDEVVLVGGHLAELLVTDPGAARLRLTDDVDVVAAITTRTQYERFSDRLRALGLKLDTSEGAPVGRWLTPDAIKVDVMPIAERVFGMDASWLDYAFESAVWFPLAEGLTLRVATAPAFLATKWAAYERRGRDDPYGSPDLEDIVAVVAGRRTVMAEVAASPPDVRTWLAARTRAFLASELCRDVVEGALPDARFDPALIDRTLQRLRAIALF